MRERFATCMTVVCKVLRKTLFLNSHATVFRLSVCVLSLTRALSLSPSLRFPLSLSFQIALRSNGRLSLEDARIIKKST